jgi:Fe-S cluster assembly protein SufD
VNLDMTTTNGTGHYLAAHESFARGRAGDPDWLTGLRRAGMEHFAELGFPTTRQEAWRYTNVAPITATPFHVAGGVRPPAPPAQVGRAAIGSSGGARLVFWNGHFAPDLSTRRELPRGVRVTSLAAVLADEPGLVEPHLARLAPLDLNGFAALGAAFLADGAFVHLPAGSVVPDPIELLFLSSSSAEDLAAFPRVLVVADENSQAEIVEVHAGYSIESTGARSLTDATTEIALGDGARLVHHRVLRGGADGAHVATTQVVQGRDSEYRSFSLVLDAKMARHDLRVRFDAEGASCSLDGLYLVHDGQLVDNHTLIDHARPHGTSRELYKGILSGRARAVFNGRVIVREDAQKSDAQQTNRNLLLSERAEIDTKPELEIFADDVKCTHGAAIGPPDPGMIFYLQSRGIAEDAARHMLTQGFADEVLARIPRATLRASLESLVNTRIAESTTGEIRSREVLQ